MMYSLADLGVTSGNYNFSTITTMGSFTASATAAPTFAQVNDTDSQDTVFNDGAPGNFAAAPTLQLLTGNIDGTVFNGVPSNPENEFSVTDSNGDFVGFLYDLHNANSASFASLQGYITTFEIIPGETYSVVRTTGFPAAEYDDLLTCFASNTRIQTEVGNVPIQNIELGMRVWTKGNGLQEVMWIGSTTVSGFGLYAPIRICKNALGNSRALRVSPQHKMLIRGWRSELLFRCEEVLVSAKDLINGQTIFRESTNKIEYWHLMFTQHEIIFAEGCPAESFFLTAESCRAQGTDAQAELARLFPQITKRHSFPMALVGTQIRGAEAQALAVLGR
ncbi:MAG: Hint domain-containing protein [Paracoccaceae bacterium]